MAEALKVRGHGTSKLALQLTGLTLADGNQVNVQSQMVNRSGPSNVGNQVGTVAATTATGAAIGAAAAWGTGAAIGAGAGAAAGVIGALLTPGRPTIVFPETLLTFRVDTPVTVDLTRASAAFRYVSPDEYDRPMQTMVRHPAPVPVPCPALRRRTRIRIMAAPAIIPTIRYSSWVGLPGFGFEVVGSTWISLTADTVVGDKREQALRWSGTAKLLCRGEAVFLGGPRPLLPHYGDLS